MRAITLWQPWAHAIAHAGKRVENRRWRPPEQLIGQRIAIHAGKRIDADHLRSLSKELPDLDLRPASLALGAVVAVATLSGVAESSDEISDDQQRWWAGPIGWLLSDVRALETPIPCRGHQRIWALPHAIAQQLDKEICNGDG